MLEICCSSLTDAINAHTGGADRIELCSALSTGGLTPSLPLIKSVAKACEIPIRVLIRPREGHFVFSSDERRLIVDESRMAVDAGADGVVFGGLTEAGGVDRTLVEAILGHFDASILTFHRAIDESADIAAAYDVLCSYGVDCVLTSGGAANAIEGIDAISNLAARKGSTQIMVGAGVRPNNAARFLESGVSALHFSARRDLEAPFAHRLFPGQVSQVDSKLVAEMRAAINVHQSR